MPATETATVVLTGGLSVPLAALQLLWRLENNGFTVRLDNGSLVVSPRSQLTADDDRVIRQHRDQLVALVRYEPPEIQ
jgi:hypothetical protein